MKLSSRTQYGLRFLIHLGLNFGKGPVQLKEIAEKENISDKYLEQIVITLKPSGIIQSLRGANGGYILSRDADQITLMDIFIALEGSLDLTGNSNADPPTNTAVNLTASTIWTALRDKLTQHLENVTLQDIVESVPQPNNSNMYYI